MTIWKKIIKRIENILKIKHMRLCQVICEYNDGGSARYLIDHETMRWYDVSHTEQSTCQFGVKRRYIIPIDAKLGLSKNQI